HERPNLQSAPGEPRHRQRGRGDRRALSPVHSSNQFSTRREGTRSNSLASDLLALEQRLQALDFKQTLGPALELLGRRITQLRRNPTRELAESPLQLTLQHADFAFV